MGVVINECAHSGCRNLKLAYLTEKLMEETGFWCFDINSVNLKVTLIIGPPSYKGD